MKKTLFLIGAAAFAFASCKKDKCNTDAATLAGTYKVTAVKYKLSASVPEVDGTDLLFDEACQKDDITVLNANGTYAVSDAGTKCDPETSDSGTWSVSGSALTIDGETSAISSFDCKNLVVTQAGGITAGDKLTITFTKQ